MQRGKEEPAWQRSSLGRNNKLTHFVKEEVAGLQVLSQLKQNVCFPRDKGWIQTAENLMRVCFILLDLWEGNTRLLVLVWGDCQMCQVPGKVLNRSLWLMSWIKNTAFWRADLKLK